MPVAEPKKADSKGRVAIPGLAGAMVLVEQVSETEYRIRKAHVIPEDEITFLEERPIVLSPEDSKLFLAALDRPPRKPNAALRKAVKRYKQRYG
jgi:hypothetical protein